MASANEATRSSQRHSKDNLLCYSRRGALCCLKKQAFGRALAHFCVIFNLQPESKESLKNTFTYALQKYTDRLEESEQWKDLFDCYEQALDMFPDSEEILHQLGVHLFRAGHIEKAATYFRQALCINPDYTPAQRSLENMKTVLVEQWHFVMLNDKERNVSFHKAVEQAVKDGCTTVLDIGTGTGIFSMFAASSGALKIYACEMSEIMWTIAKDVLAANGYDDQILLLQKISTSLSIPEDIPCRVSLVVTETFDAGLLGEHVLETLDHAWTYLLLPPPPQKRLGASTEVNCFKRANSEAVHISSRPLLECPNVEKGTLPSSHQKYSDNWSLPNSRLNCEKTYGRVIPLGASVYICPMECDKIRKSYWLQKEGLELLLSNITITAEIRNDDPYTTECLATIRGGYKFLGEPYKLLEIDFNDPKNIECLLDGVVLTHAFKSIEVGTVDALAMWFDLHISEEVTLSTNPNSRGCWEQAVYSVLPYHLQGSTNLVKKNDYIEVTMQCKGHLSLFSTRILPNKDDTNEGMMLINSFCLDDELIPKLNTCILNSSLIEEVKKVVLSSPDIMVIDLCDFPWLGLMAAKLGAKKVCTLFSEHHEKIKYLQSLCQIPADKVLFESIGNLLEYRNKWDLLIINPVEPCGLLKSGILDDVTLLRNSCLKPSAVILPSKLTIYAMIVESEALLEQARLLGNERTLGFQIAEFINIFQAKTHQDIDMSSVPHQKLSGVVKFCDIDFNRYLPTGNAPPSFQDISAIVNVKVIKSGRLSAIPYWYVINNGSDSMIDTFDPKNSYKQAVFIPNEETLLSEGSRVCLYVICRNSMLDIKIEVL